MSASNNRYRDEFLSQIKGLTNFHKFKCDSSNLSDIFNWSDLNQILQTKKLSYPRFKLVKNGKLLDQQKYSYSTFTPGRGTFLQLNENSVVEEMKNNASLILNHVDEFVPTLKSICQDLEKIFYCDSWVNVYGTFGNEEGFGIHWDDHDVIVLQLDGKKNWQIFDKSREHPISGDPDNKPAPEYPNERLILEPGDGLFIPRGQWHNVSPEGTSLHLTFTVFRKKWVDYFHWAIDHSKFAEFLRTDIDFSNASIGNLNKEIIQVFNQESINSYNDYCKTKSITNQIYNFPYSVTKQFNENQKVSLNFQRSVEITPLGSSYVLVMNGERYELESESGEVVKEIGSEGTSIYELYSKLNLTKSKVNHIISELLEYRLVNIES